MAQAFFLHTLDNGLTLVGEKMPAVQSAAMTLLLPAGSAGDPIDRTGSAAVLSDLVLRGAGARDSRQLTDYLDSLGLQRASSVSVHHTRFGCAAVADRVVESLAAYADIVRRPLLPETGFEAARDLALQALEGLEDDPRQKLLVKLREWFLPSPLGRNPMGEVEHLQKLTLELNREDWKQRYHANGAILALAGNIEFDRIREEAEKHFGTFAGKVEKPMTLMPPPGPYYHEKQKSEQTHIGIAYRSVPETDPDYYVVRAAMEVFGGGMSGRLFTEVREKRGLCYSVWSGYTALKSMGTIMSYAGSSNERAQATLDCILGEIHRLEKGITQAELDRAKIGLKAGTIMQGESTSARAGTIAHDYFMRGRIRTLDEIKQEIDRLTVDQVNKYLASHPPGPFTIVTVGPKKLRAE
ncbi:MAG TPA: pitrilysin family protein [Tepidisphaeraceae bacterium]|nr:pitrilysin family protein [Tepidisphaeraceae bacterium]